MIPFLRRIVPKIDKWRQYDSHHHHLKRQHEFLPQLFDNIFFSFDLEIFTTAYQQVTRSDTYYDL